MCFDTGSKHTEKIGNCHIYNNENSKCVSVSVTLMVAAMLVFGNRVGGVGILFFSHVPVCKQFKNIVQSTGYD